MTNERTLRRPTRSSRQPGSPSEAPDFDRIAADLHAAVISDSLDSLGNLNHALGPNLLPIDPTAKVIGRAATMQLVEESIEPERPYEDLIAAVDRLPRESVVVIAASGTSRCALWGELFSTAARARGARGTVVDGCVRDTAKVIAMGFPLFATGTRPLDSKGRARLVSDGVAVEIHGVRITPGDLIFGDRDGVVVIPAELEVETIARAYEKVGKEGSARSALSGGALLKNVWDKYRVL